MEKNNDLTDLQKQHQEQMKEKRDAIKRRKLRTRRLIIRGAIAEKMIQGAESMTDEEFQENLSKLAAKGAIATSNPQDSVGRPLRENPSKDTS